MPKKTTKKLDPPADEGMEKVEIVNRLSVWQAEGANGEGRKVPVVVVSIDYASYGPLQFGMPQPDALRFAHAIIRAAGEPPRPGVN